MMDRPEFCGAGVAACPDDAELWYRVCASGLPRIRRSPASVQKGQPLKVIFDFVKDLDCTHVMWVNPCQPLLRNETILDAATVFAEEPAMEALTAAKEVRTMVWDSDGVPIANVCADRTDRMRPVYLAAHSFHIWDRDRMLTEGVTWHNTGTMDPYRYVIENPTECIDVDTMHDFELLRALYSYRQVTCG